MATSSQVENALGMAPTEREKEELERKMDIKISRVERER
jgi:hypothetical protein